MARKSIPAPAADRTVTAKDNAPPDPFDAHKTHMDDLYIETANWADGAEIETAEQAAVVDRLIADWKEAIDGAKASEVEATKPLQDEVKAIQQRYWPLIGETKTVTGIAVRAKTALLAVKSKWGRKLEAERAAEAERLRKEAAVQSATAAQAVRDALGDLAATEQAEDLVRGAQDTLRAAREVEKPAIKGMRDSWVIKGFAEPVEGVTGQRALFAHYLKTDPDAMLEAALELARIDVRNGKRVIPGLIIENERKAV